MPKQNEIKFVLLGIILVIIAGFVIWAIQNQKIDLEASITKPASLSLSPSIGTYKVGQKVKIDVIIDAENLKITEINAILDYDPAIISIIDENSDQQGVQIKPSDLPFDYYENIVDTENHLIKISGIVESNDSEVIINGPTVLALIEFVPLQETSSASLNFRFEKNKTSDSNIYTNYKSNNEQDVLFGVLNGTYEFTN